MDENTYELIINSAKHPMGIAKIAEVIFNGKYKVHIIQRRVTWFEKEDDGTFKIIDDVIIRRKLSSDDFINLIVMARDKFKNNTKDINLEEMMSNHKSLDVLNKNLLELVEKRKELREQNKIDEARSVEAQIKNAEDTIKYTKDKIDLYRLEIKDTIFSRLTQMENNLYNIDFKNKVVKELADILYQPNN
jgi:hypothetical protein